MFIQRKLCYSIQDEDDAKTTAERQSLLAGREEREPTAVKNSLHKSMTVRRNDTKKKTRTGRETT